VRSQVYVVVEYERLDSGSIIHPRAYATREAAAKRLARLEARDDEGYSTFQVEELELVGEPHATVSQRASVISNSTFCPSAM
jgi:hypothetical protein